jgi:hypothetical protein
MKNSGEMAAVNVGVVPPLGHAEAMRLAETEFARMVDLLRQLRPDEWTQPTVCDLWDVRGMVAHVVGMAEARPRSGSSRTICGPRTSAPAVR